MILCLLVNVFNVKIKLFNLYVLLLIWIGMFLLNVKMILLVVFGVFFKVFVRLNVFFGGVV